MNRMKMLSLSLLLGATMLVGFASSALALTDACTTISNEATLSYSINGVSQTDIDSDELGSGDDTTDFAVDTLVNLAVTEFNSPVTAASSDNVLIFRVENLGNDIQDYELVLYNAAATNTYNSGTVTTDDFDMNNIRVYYDKTPDGSYDVGDPALTFTGSGDSLGEVAGIGVYNSADLSDTFEVYVIADVPSGVAPGKNAVYGLMAKTHQVAGEPGDNGTNGTETGNSSSGSTANSCGGDVVLGDLTDADTQMKPGGGWISDDAENGDHYAVGHYTVANANISVTKDVKVLWDPINTGSGTQYYIPGAYVQYNIAITNSGAASATLSTITDTLTAELDIDPDLITGADADPSDGPYASGGTGKGFMVELVPDNRDTSTYPAYFTTTSSADGIDFADPTITATFSAILPGATDTGYSAGELKAGETVKIKFNAIIK